MFSHSQAYSGFSVDDIAAARAFYGDVLGLRLSETNGMLTLHLAGGGRVLIYPKPDHRPASFTVLNLPVVDIDAAVDGLIGVGIKLESYEGMPQDERGVLRPPTPGWGRPIAWFKDPAGNILSVLQAGRPGGDESSGPTVDALGGDEATSGPTGNRPAADVNLQLSVYPLRQPHLRPAIQRALEAAAGQGVEVTVGRLSTFVRGDEPAVFAALRAAFRAAGSSGSTVLVATLANGAPTNDTVADIQREIVGKESS